MATLNRNRSTITAVLNSVLASQLYGFTARSDTPWPNDSTPPANITQTDFENEIIFLERIQMNEVSFQILRDDWQASSYSVGDIVFTSVHRVYQCASAGTSVNAPNHLSGTAPDVGGTATWTFLEEVDKDYLITPELIPLSIASEKLFYKTPSLVKEIWVTFDITGDESGYLPIARQYRVIGLYMNPLQNSFLNDTYSVKSTVKEYGYPFLYKAIPPAIRTDEQVERYVFQISIDE